VILSVCPPHAARDVARDVAREGFRGLYVDGNAVSPATGREVGAIVEAGGATFVDGGIIGPPPTKPGTTRFYLSGKDAVRVVPLLKVGPLDAIVVDGPAGAASAVKMAYAAYTKGSAALLIAIRALATAEGVDEALIAEWNRSQPDLPGKSESVAGRNAKKAWRFVGEMEEIAATFKEAGLPEGFHQAAADIYQRMAAYKDTPPPSIADVAKELLAKRR
jgi:3-hydroxyisobutyrate dehydrogenase-like beta-hydroxyacid dehydrogenase